MKQERPKAILIDYYGTLVEEDDILIQKVCKQIADASHKDAAEIGIVWSNVFTAMCIQGHGKSFRLQKDLERLSLEQVLLKYEVDLDPDKICQYLFDYWMKPQIFPESRSVLGNIDIPVCLVSNIDNKELTSALDYTELVFDHIVTSEDCRSYKPRSEMFEAALSQLGCDRQDVIHVGDSVSSDIVGARASGIRSIWINRKARRIDKSHKPDYTFGSLDGVLDVLRNP